MNISRRKFVGTALATGMASCGVGCRTFRSPSPDPLWVNDVHSNLNRTPVRELLEPDSPDALGRIVKKAWERRTPLAVSGARHAMGGQQFLSRATLIDTRKLNRILQFDRTRGLLDVEAGIQWPELIRYLHQEQPSTRAWGIAQKQTGADDLTLGGALAANIHGRGLQFRPFVQDVESFRLVKPDGQIINCSRTENADLFRHGIGGYGLFGPVYSIQLRLRPRQKIRRMVKVGELSGLVENVRKRVEAGFLYGDFQFSIDEKDPKFLREGVFSCYEPVPDETPIPESRRELRAEDWENLVRLAHEDKAAVYQRYTGYYLSTHGQVYWSDLHQLSPYLPHYHDRVSANSGGAASSEIISELYVPRSELENFMWDAAHDLASHHINVIYGTVRFIEQDSETILPWARQSYACIIFNLHTEHTSLGLETSAAAFRRLIDLAQRRGGNYYLTYHRYASTQQLRLGYPTMVKFLQAQKAWDPRGIFSSNWHQHVQKQLSA